MSRRYDSRRRSETMRASNPTQTPATDACSVYRQQWRRSDGGQARTFDVLALDEEQARVFGEVRLTDKYGADADVWLLIGQTKLERHTALVLAILTTETREEDRLREDTFHDRREASGADTQGAAL